MLVFDPVFFLFVGPAFLLAMYAGFLTKTRFEKYSQVGVSSGMTGAQAAAMMLHREGITDVTIEQVGGFLADHYDPTHRKLRLSPDVYGGKSLAAIGVACHEAGHALQHANGYAPLQLRSALVPVTGIASNMSQIILFIGAFAAFGSGNTTLLQWGVAMLAVVVFFTLVTLPVEWDASARAKVAMVNDGLVTPQEAPHAAKVLNAAFLTYVASAVSAIMTMLYWALRAGLLGARSE